MDELDVRQLVDDIQSGDCSPDEAVARLRRLPFTELGYAKVDHHRPLRQGMVEAIYGPGKTPAQCAGIVEELLAGGSGPVLLTRGNAAQSTAAMARDARAAVCRRRKARRRATRRAPGDALLAGEPTRPGRILVCSAGTADQVGKRRVRRDIAGLRLPPRCTERLRCCRSPSDPCRLSTISPDADAVVVIAGMEGALASLVGGLTPAPVDRRANLSRLRRRPRRRHGPARHARLVCGRSECRRHRQRLSVRLAQSLGCCDEPRAADRLVQLLLRHLRRHDPRQPRRRWGRHRRARQAARPHPRSAAGRSSSNRSCAMGSRQPARSSSANDDGVVRTFMHVIGLLEEARLPERVRARAVAAFSALAEVEGRLHRRPPAQVHFHEVGGHDAIVDVVGSAIALELLGIDTSRRARRQRHRRRADLARHAPEPCTRCGRAARRHPDSRSRRQRRAHDADWSGHAARLGKSTSDRCRR